jgi:diaminopimelate decarboxylase
MYVYDYNVIKGQILKLKKNLPPNVRVYYSVKANPNIAILRIMKKFGLGAQIVSLGEFTGAKRAGFNGDDVIFCGSIKSDNEIRQAIKHGIDLIGVESFFELQRLNKIVNGFSRPKKQKIIIRLDPSDFNAKSSLPRRQKVLGFGLSLDELKKILIRFPGAFPSLDLKGIHIYQIRDVFDSGVLAENTERVFSIVLDLEKQSGLHFETVNIGGGFGSNSRSELQVLDFGRRLRELISKYSFADRKIILELGRYLVNNAGSFITDIIDLQKINNRQIIAVSGIVNCIIRALGPPDGIARFRDNIQNYPIDILSPSRSGPSVSSLVRGQSSTTADIFGRNFLCEFAIPPSKIGDLIRIRGVGAYGLTQSLLSFCSRPTAAEFLLINGKLELIRDKGEAGDFLLHQRIPSTLK